jgi:hypothetical protein
MHQQFCGEKAAVFMWKEIGSGADMKVWQNFGRGAAKRMEGLRDIMVSKLFCPSMPIEGEHGSETFGRNGPLRKYGWPILPSTVKQGVFPSIVTLHKKPKGVSMSTPFSFRKWMKHHTADQRTSCTGRDQG